MCVYGRGGVCVRGEREDVCIWKGWSVRASGEGGYVYMEGVECACIGRGKICVYGRGGVCVHGERNDEGVCECVSVVVL